MPPVLTAEEHLKAALEALKTPFTELRANLAKTSTLDLSKPEHAELALQTGFQMNSIALSLSDIAEKQKVAYPASKDNTLLRVADSFNRMSTGFKTIGEANRALQTARSGQVALQNFHVGTGVFAIAAGLGSLVASQGPDLGGMCADIRNDIATIGRDIRNDIRTVARELHTEIFHVGEGVAAIIKNQQMMFTAIQGAVDGVQDIKALVTQHMQTTQQAHDFIATRELRENIDIMQRYIAGKSTLSNDAVNILLGKLQNWFKELQNPVINHLDIADSTSERMVSMLHQKSPLEIMGLIAARLRFLFGDNILDVKYTTLPPLETYRATASAVLLGMQKSGCVVPDACDDIQKTFQLYLEFLKDVQGNTRLWQTLFDAYDTYRDKVGRVLFVTNKTNVAALANSPSLFAMEEIRLILTSLSSCVEDCNNPGEKTRRVLAMDDLDNILRLSVLDAQQKRLSIPSTAKTPVEQYRAELRLGLTCLNRDTWSGHLTTPARHECFKTAIDMQFLNLIQDVAITSEPPFSLMPASKYEPHPYGMMPHPIDAPLIFFIAPKDASQVACKSYGPYGFRQPTTPYVFKPLSQCTLVMYLLYLVRDRTTPAVIKESTPSKRLFLMFDHSTQYFERIGMMVKYPCSGKIEFEYFDHITAFALAQPILLDGRNRGDLELSAERGLSAEYAAFIKNLVSADIEQFKILFNYYTLFSQGQLKAAESYIRQQIFNHDHEKSYLLLFVSILGRWDIFESFTKIHPFSPGTPYNWVLKNTQLTFLMIAAQHGREDVVNGLIQKLSPADMMKRSFDNKTAAQLAYEQGFYKIAFLLKAGLSEQELQQCQNNIPVEIVTAVQAPEVSSLTTSITLIQDAVTYFKTGFQAQVEAKRSAPTATATQVAAIPAVDPQGYETDPDKIEILGDEHDVFCDKRGLPKTSKWHKPHSPEQRRTGLRIFADSGFPGDRKQQKKQRLALKGHLSNEAVIPHLNFEFQ